MTEKHRMHYGIFPEGGGNRVDFCATIALRERMSILMPQDRQEQQALQRQVISELRARLARKLNCAEDDIVFSEPEELT